MLVMAAVLVFACMDAAGKHLMSRFNVPFVAFVRYALNLALLAVVMGRCHGSALWATQRTGLVVLRGVSLAASTFFCGSRGPGMALIAISGAAIAIHSHFARTTLDEV